MEDAQVPACVMRMGGIGHIEEETCLQIINGIAAGGTVKSALEDIDPGEVTRETVQRRFFAALAKSENLAQLYARAQKSRAQAQFERIGEIAEQVLQGELDPQAARVAIDAWKWTTGRQDPKKYGDKLQLETTDDKKQLSREEVLQQLAGSGLRVADVFASLTKRAEPGAGDLIELSAPALPAETEEAEDDLSGLDSQ